MLLFRRFLKGFQAELFVVRSLITKSEVTSRGECLISSGQLLGHHKSSSGCDIMQLLIFDELIKDSSPITKQSKKQRKQKQNKAK